MHRTRVSLKQIDRVTFWACIVDVLFLPYFWLISVPLSMPLVAYWFLRRGKIIRAYADHALASWLVATMCIASALGAAVYPFLAYRNFVYLLSFSYIIVTYFIFAHYLRHRTVRMDLLLTGLLAFVLVTVAIYYQNRELYSRIVTLWNLRSGGQLLSLYQDFSGYRYSFVWTDPNNIAYMLSAVVLFLWFELSVGVLLRAVSLVTLLLVLVASMSSGGWLAFGTSFSLALLGSAASVAKKLRAKDRATVRRAIRSVVFTGAIAVVGVRLVLANAERISENATVVEAIERLDQNTSESRVDIWRNIVDDMSPLEGALHLITGFGGASVVAGVPRSPHNGHLYWVISFGVISYGLLMALLFRRRRGIGLLRSVWLLPIFLGFSVNIMLGEAKLFGLVMLMIAYRSVRSVGEVDVQ